MPQPCAVILAGGRSSRMGTPKDSLILVGGKTMIERVIDALRPLTAEIYLSTRTAPSPEQIELGLPILCDATPFDGPLVAIAQAMKELHGRDLLIVCCDQPLLQSPVLNLLLQGNSDDRPAFFATEDGESLAPFPGYFPAGVMEEMALAIEAGEKSPRRWSQTRECRWVTLDEAAAKSLSSFNSREELLAADLLDD